MCHRTLQNLHCWDIELPKHGSLVREPALCVCFTLISAWNQREWVEDEDDIVFIVFKVALAHTWPLWWRRLALFILFLVCVCVCEPTLAECFHSFHWGFHWSSPCCPPQHNLSLAVYLESATASGGSRGAFWSLLARASFCCLGRFFRRGSDTVMHSVLLPGASRSSSRVRLCWEYKVTWTSSCPHALSFPFQVVTYVYKVQHMAI